MRASNLQLLITNLLNFVEYRHRNAGTALSHHQAAAPGIDAGRALCGLMI